MADRPEIITIVWDIRVKHPVQYPKLRAALILGWTALIILRIIFDILYFSQCLKVPNIHIVLVLLALTHQLLVPFVTFSCEKDAARPWENPRGAKAFLQLFIVLFLDIWLLAGELWIVLVYLTSYDPTADDDMCILAKMNTVWETIVVFFFLTKLCKCCCLCVKSSTSKH